MSSVNELLFVCFLCGRTFPESTSSVSVCLYVMMSESLPVRVNELSKVLLGLISCPSSQLEKNVLDFKESLGSLSSSGKLIELFD